MITAAFDPTLLVTILPEIGLVVLAGIVLLLDLVWRNHQPRQSQGPDPRRSLGWLTAGGLLLVAGLALVFARPDDQPELIWGGMLRLDWLGFVFKLVFLFGAAVTALMAMDTRGLGQRGEFYFLLLVATLGLSLMAAAADLVMLFLAIETTSIPLYLLAGFLRDEEKSTEAGMKYLLFGAIASAVMLYGFSLLYGITGATQLYRMFTVITETMTPTITLLGVLLLMLVGFGFKIAAAPFHFWAPDVYEGAPTPVAGFLSTASKAGGFAVLIRVLSVAFPVVINEWVMLLVVLSSVSMILGNVLALTQKNIKRLLAYSSIAQAGYILIGVASATHLGNAAAVYYLVAYLVTNLAVFGVIAVVGREIGSDDLTAYAGLSRRSPGLALVLMAAVLSLGGIPPFAGFFGKFFVIGAAIQSGLLWLAVLGVLNSIVGLYYYLYILKVVYLDRSPDDAEGVPLTAPWKLALALCVVGILVLGVVFAPWFQWADLAARGIF